MLSKKDLKILWRSKSWQFMRNCRKEPRGDGEIAELIYNHNPIYFRPGTSDCRLIYEILFYPKSEYKIPVALDPKTIVDIGANIGITSVSLTKQFPKAKIFAFEPIEDNFLLLKRNTQRYLNITAFQVALGSKNEERDIFFSDSQDNFGGFSLFAAGSNTAIRKRVLGKETAMFFLQLGISKLDIIKIDTEGSEFDILTSINPEMLKETSWIVGELHGERDFEVLNYLNPWFDICVKKSFKKRMFNFHACNRMLFQK